MMSYPLSFNQIKSKCNNVKSVTSYVLIINKSINGRKQNTS